MGGKVVDEVDEKVENSMFWLRTVGRLSQHLGLGAFAWSNKLKGPFQGWALRLGLGPLIAFGG